MTANQSKKLWVLIILLLVVVITIGAVVACSRYGQNQPIEISMPPSPELQGEAYIEGAVSNPGIYTVRIGDTLEALIQAAGNTTSNADLSYIKIHIPETGEKTQPQKIDLNRAEAWLLEALPAIGEARAQAIIDYRNQNGAFRSINELLKVEGIGASTYDKIKHLITVAD
ncbi:MAG: ComEA family DNA-binding protein [Chloroflexi bacterium]|nr:ComEA family DNA-binding protein [Chloroflexota bacterium]